jgi:hypothetical protein
MRRGARAIGMATLGFAVFWAVSWILSEGRPSKQKARIVQTLVRQERSRLAHSVPQSGLGALYRPWPDDSLVLENWLSIQSARDRTPGEILNSLLTMENRQTALSQGMRETLQHWSDALQLWSSEAEPAPSTVPEEALKRGRLHFLQARGYSDIGRTYDATVLYLWASYWLDRAVDTARSDTDFPEILYLLGTIYLTLRHSVPAPFHGEKLLYVCSDLYPSSIWASRANSALHFRNTP